MGDLIELTAWPNHQSIFYKATSSAISFEVKAIGNAFIGVAKQPGITCDLQIALGHNHHSWIKLVQPRGVKKTVETPNILSPAEYRRFWIKWYGESVVVGRDGQKEPIIISKCQGMSNLKYVTFSVLENSMNPVHWRVEVPPLLEKPILKPIQGGDLHWVQVDSANQFPDGALIGGFENENLYIIRAPHSGSLTPGKYVPSKGIGYVGWSWDAHEKHSFEVLCGFDCTWVKSSFANIPAEAVVGGESENAQREKLYIGRIKHRGHLIPGKVQTSHRVCFVACDGKEVGQGHYEILVHPKINTANTLLQPHYEIHHDNYNEDEDDDEDDNDPYEHDNFENIMPMRL